MGIFEMAKIVIVILSVILVILIVVLIILGVKKFKDNMTMQQKKKKVVEEKKTPTATSQYNKQSVFDFMEFEKIEDNMIIQKSGIKYLMIVECQGINYDLMSGIEKVSVEKGFIQFLNTLRQPIQLYVQTRTVNLGSSLNNYRARVENIGQRLSQMTSEYNQMIHSPETIVPEKLQELEYEIIKQRNLYDYAVDILNNTEQMSLNKNILRKYYYIIVPHYVEDTTEGKYDKEEIKGIAFSDLYTSCQSLIHSLNACGVHGKIMDSREIAELLYVAYNRDESETYELEKALRSGYNELYTTAQDVLDKKMKELDNVIKERAKILANSVIRESILETKKEREIRRKEEQMNSLVRNTAREMITESEGMLGKELTEKATNRISQMQSNEKGDLGNEKTKGTRRATGKRQ